MTTDVGTAEVYCMKERVRIVQELDLDYLVEDLETGKSYIVDKVYFGRRYVQEGDMLPPHTELWDKLHSLATENLDLKKKLNRTRKRYKALKREIGKNAPEKGERQHLRKGQKRGAHGRHG